MARYYGDDPKEYTVDEWAYRWENVGLPERLQRPKTELERVQELAAEVERRQAGARQKRDREREASR